MYLSIAGSGSALKAVRAILAQPKVQFQLAPIEYSYEAMVGSSYRMRRCDDGYDSYSVAIGYGQYHLVMVTKNEKFMPVKSAETLWQRLVSSDYTTPLVKDWLPWLFDQVVENEYMDECRSDGCKPATLSLTSSQLDSLVTTGLRAGELRI